MTSWGFGFNRQTCGGTGFVYRTETEDVINSILGIVGQYAPSELSEIEILPATP